MASEVRDDERRACIAIDLKSFYASVECMDRGLDPLRTHLVVADESRTDKTICLAVSPSLKRCTGLPGRVRLFEARRRLEQVNAERAMRAPGHRLVGESCDERDLERSARLKATMIIAKPRMARYMEVSGQIYGIYLDYIAPEDIHVYSIDEVFIDATRYLKTWGMSARELASTMVRDIARRTGITATAGLGTNLYLAKVAMDILAKHESPDANGVRIAELDERSYRRRLWGHRPLTDFWRIGRGLARRLEGQGLMTMGDVARCSLGGAEEYYNEDLLYRLFGVNAELIIDHAWGWESATIADIKDYRPDAHSVSSGQALTAPTLFPTARLIVKEMADALALDLMERGVVTDRVTLFVGYDIASLDPARLDACASEEVRQAAGRAAQAYAGAVDVDRYGRRKPKSATGSVSLGGHTASCARLREAFAALCDRIVDPLLLVRYITVIADGVLSEEEAETAVSWSQPDLFAEPVQDDENNGTAGTGWADRSGLAAGSDGVSGLGGFDGFGGGNRPGSSGETDVQRALLDIKRKFGRDAVIKAMDMEPGATGRDRNRQIGGHAA